MPVQPLIEPLFVGLTELEFLARVAGETTTKPYNIVRDTFGTMAGVFSEDAWRKFLYLGFHEGSADKAVNVRIKSSAVAKAIADSKPPQTPTAEGLEVIFHRDYSVDDGRYANNGWLQEVPDLVTKISWDNVVLVSRKTARATGSEERRRC